MIWKRYTAILFLFVAYAILLGHNLIPHHHHDHDSTAKHHSHGHHDNGNDENKSDDLNHILTHFMHSAEGFSFLISHNIPNTLLKQHIPLVAVLPYNFSIDELQVPHLRDKPPAVYLVYISPHFHPSGLRAPPATII